MWFLGIISFSLIFSTYVQYNRMLVRPPCKGLHKWGIASEEMVCAICDKKAGT